MNLPMEVLEDHREEVLDVDFSPEGGRLVTASKDSTCCVYNVNLGLLEHRLVGHQREVTKVKFSHQGDFVLSTGADGVGRVWNS